MKKFTKTNLSNLSHVLVLLMFIIIAIVCFFSFEYTRDISHTVSCSYALLNGHIFDLYEYCTKYYEEICYMPTMYIVLAIWNLPLKLLGVNIKPMHFPVNLPIILWNKLFLVIVYFLTGYFIYKICMLLEWNRKQSRMCAWSWIFIPVAFFTQFCLGLYDSITVFFVIVAIWFYIRNKDRNDQILFLLFFGLAITCKTMIIIYLFPFILVQNKKILSILFKTIVCFSPCAFYILLFSSSQAFINGVFGNQYYELFFYSEIWLINPAFILMIVMYALSYFRDVKCQNKNNVFANILWYCNMLTFALFGLCLTHPNWILLATPFFIWSLYINKKFEAYMWVIIIMSLAYFAFFSTMPGPHSEGLINGGLFGNSGFGILSPVFTLESIYKIPRHIAFTVMSGALLVLGVFSHPKYLSVEKNCVYEGKFYILWSYLFGILGFLLPTLLCVIPTGLVGGNCFSVYDEPSSRVSYIGNNNIIEQKVYNQVKSWDRLQFWGITWDRYYDENAKCKIEIICDNKNEVVYEQYLDMNSINNNAEYTDIELNYPIGMEKNCWYRIRFINNFDQDFAIKTSATNAIRIGKGYIIENGIADETTTLDINIFGK